MWNASQQPKRPLNAGMDQSGTKSFPGNATHFPNILCFPNLFPPFSLSFSRAFSAAASEFCLFQNWHTLYRREKEHQTTKNSFSKLARKSWERRTHALLRFSVRSRSAVLRRSTLRCPLRYLFVPSRRRKGRKSNIKADG